MALKDLLAYVDNEHVAERTVEAAVKLAGTTGTHITGLHIIRRPYITGYVKAEFGQQVLDDMLKSARGNADELEQSFNAAAAERDIASAWRRVECNESAFSNALNAQARCADLLLVDQSDDDIAAKVVIDAGSPVLVIPDDVSIETVGRRVLVAWNGSREAIRAVHDALGVLENADAVKIVGVGKSAGEAGASPDLPDICLHLKRHGVDAEAVAVAEKESHAGEVVMEQATDLDCDLIVMGAYGHTRMRELILGGVTNHVLKNTGLPLFMSH